MIIGDRLRAIREAKEFSQGDIEKRTGLLRCYISRVENGHTVPTVETLEKMARALEVPMYKLFYDGAAPPKLENLPKRKTADEIAWGSSGKDAQHGKAPKREVILKMVWGAPTVLKFLTIMAGRGCSCARLSKRDMISQTTRSDIQLRKKMGGHTKSEFR